MKEKTSEINKCDCGATPSIIIENPSSCILVCNCGKRTNGCNDEEHAIYCWNNGFVFFQTW